MNKAINNPLKRALWISLAVSSCSLSLKIAAFVITGSTAALADATESVVHLFTVLFVLYGYYLSLKPPDDDHPYGHERVEFFSVAAEGSVMILAGGVILWQSVTAVFIGVELRELNTGIWLLAGSAFINLFLGRYLVRIGRKHDNMIVVSNGKHTLTDVWTSGGVVFSLLLIGWTGWLFMDIVMSVMIASFIIHEAYKLLRYSVSGLMDTRKPEVDRALRQVLESPLPGFIRDWHHLRHRTSGRTTWVELHLVFDDDIPLSQAHDDATRLERKLIDALSGDAIVTLHLEPDDSHDASHRILRGANRDKDLDDFI